MSSFSHCIVKLRLGQKLPLAELKSLAAEYEGEGMTPEAAFARAVEDKLQLARMEEQHIVKAVRQAWEAKGGAKPERQTAPQNIPENIPAAAQPAAGHPEPAPVAEPKPAPAGKASAPTAEQENAKPESTKPAAAPKESDPVQVVHDVAKASPFAKYETVRDEALAKVKEATGKNWSEHEASRGSFFHDALSESIHAGQYAGMQDYAATLPVKISESAIPAELAERAFAGTSHSPEQRGASARRAYFREVMGLWKKFEPAYNAGPDDRKAAFVEAFNDVAAKYASLTNTYLASHSRVASAMIAGPARFPTESNRKKSEAADRRAQEANEYLGKAEKRLAKVLRGAVDNSLASALKEAEDKLAAREKAQEHYKAVNAALRKGDDAKLAELGYTPEQIAHLKKPDFAGRTGVPDYQLKNNNAEIRRMRERVAEIQRRIAAAEQAVGLEGESSAQTDEAAPGVRMVQNAEANRLQLFFDDKPSADVREQLKSNGFRWAPSSGAWQRQLTDNAVRAAQGIMQSVKPSATSDEQGDTLHANASRTIEVDGIRRPVENSLGQPVATEFPEQKAFWKWFGDSKAVDDQGRPLVVYHGTKSQFDRFDLKKAGASDPGLLGEAIYFTPSEDQARTFAESPHYGKGDMPNVLTAYVSLQNPAIIEDGVLPDGRRLTDAHPNGISRQSGEALNKELKKAGYDGALFRSGADLMQVVAFDPDQVQLATEANSNRNAKAGQSTAGPMDDSVAQMVKDGTTTDKVLAHIAANSDNADYRALAQALQKQNLKTGILYGAPTSGTYAAGVDAIQATASYNAATDTARIHQVDGAEQNVLHELVHAASLKALSKGGLAAQQIKSLWAHVKALPHFANEYGIANAEEFVAEAYTNQRFAQMLADTPAPGTPKLSLWQKLAGIVRMLLGKPPIADNVLARVMTAQNGLFAENRSEASPAQATPQRLRASISSALGGAVDRLENTRLGANYLVGDFLNQTGKISWWHKTIGTMDNLARRHPAFAPVYDAVQRFIGDVSRHAVAAADQAPTLLPKLDSIRDVLGKDSKHAVSATDTKAIAGPIFEGTLAWARDAHGNPVKVTDLEDRSRNMSTLQKAKVLLQHGVIDDHQHQAWQGQPESQYDAIIGNKYAATQLKAGVVWSDAELRSMFHLNDHQIDLYREFRKATDESLTRLSISEMVKLGGKEAKPLFEQAVNAGSLDAAATLLRDHFVQLARENPDEADMHNDTANQIMNAADKAKDLIDRGYAPLARFGKYTVYVEKDGEQLYFGMFEGKAEAARMARQMRLDNPDAQVLHGTVSEEAYKLFSGISPETIELFGSMVGLDQNADPAAQEVYQAYLKLAKNNRSAMKRLIHRKGIAGFSEDAARVLSSFIYSNARLTSANSHMGEIDEAVKAIPKQQGELTDAAVQLREQIRNPENGGAQLGGLMFAQFLGGSVASALVNMTQPVAMTLPYLSQFGGTGKAASRLLAAYRDAAKKTTGDAQLDAALKWAADEGIVAPQEIHYLQALAKGRGALRSGDGTAAGNARAALNNTMSKVQLGWGKLFALAELANRRVTFIAAYRTAVEEGKLDPAKFAEDAVTQTQGMYNAGNRPKWARNPVGNLLMTFKQYSIAYLELFSRMAFAGEPGSPERAAGQRAALLMMGVLFMLGGADGLPFEQDLEDAIDGLMQRLGYNFSTKRAKQKFLVDTLGEGGADFAIKGISSMPGMPIDVAGRFGMGNLIPGTGLLTRKEDHTSDLGELAGPAGDIAKRAFTGAGKLLGGDVGGAALDLAPQSVRNVAKGADMLETGSYNDARGYKVNDTTPTEAVLKMVGFQPNSTADVQDAKGQALNMLAQTRMRSKEIAEHWAQGMAANDPAMVQQARDWMHDWNEKNPDTPIHVSMPGVLRRVSAMREDAQARTTKTAPKALQQTVQRELSETRS